MHAFAIYLFANGLFLGKLSCFGATAKWKLSGIIGTCCFRGVGHFCLLRYGDLEAASPVVSGYLAPKTDAGISDLSFAEIWCVLVLSLPYLRCLLERREEKP